MSAILPLATVIATCPAVAMCPNRSLPQCGNFLLFNNLIGASKQLRRDIDAKRLGSLGGLLVRGFTLLGLFGTTENYCCSWAAS
jgi:hypothetical protein